MKLPERKTKCALTQPNKSQWGVVKREQNDMKLHDSKKVKELLVNVGEFLFLDRKKKTTLYGTKIK